MLRGFVAGGLWGALIGVIVIALTAQIAALRDLTPAVTEEMAAAEPAVEAPRAPEETAGPEPAGVEPAPETGTAPVTETTEAEPETTPETTPPPTPEVAVAADEPASPDAAGEPAPEATAAETAPQVSDTPPSTVTAGADPDAASETAPPPAPEIAEIAGLLTTPSGSAGPDVTVAPVPGGAPEAPAPQGVAGTAPDSAPTAALDAPLSPAPETATEIAGAGPAPAAGDAPPSGLPGTGAAPSVADLLQRPAETTPPAETVPAPEVAEAPQPLPVVTEPPAAEPEPEPEQVARVEPRIIDTSREGAATGTIGNRATGVKVNRLPVLGGDAQTQEEAASEEQVATPAGAGALAENRVAFTRTGTGPLAAVILLPGTEVPDPASAGFPVTVAVDAATADAATIAEAYRSVGAEIALIPALPRFARPADVEVALQSTLRDVKGAVAFLDPGTVLPSDRKAVAQFAAVAAANGLGIVTAPRGLNTAAKEAEKAGVPSALILGDIVGAGASEASVKRALDQAAFRARQGTGAVLIARSDAETLAALRAWVAEGAGGLEIAPLSAVLLEE